MEEVKEDSKGLVKSHSESAFDELLVMKNNILTKHKLVINLLRKVHKKYGKERKRKIRLSRSSVRTPSGFTVPSPVSAVLLKFMGLKSGKLVSRAQATKKISQYIRKHKLQAPHNYRLFIPDTKLQSILSPLDDTVKDKNGKTDKDKGYSYFNLQKYLAAQFIKEASQ